MVKSIIVLTLVLIIQVQTVQGTSNKERDSYQSASQHIQQSSNNLNLNKKINQIDLPPSYSKFNTDINSPDVQIVVFSSHQYHFIPLGSYFQFSLSSYQFQFDSAFLSHLSYQIAVHTNNARYNLIVLDSLNQGSSQSFRCYQRAVNEGIPSLMEGCFSGIETGSAENDPCNSAAIEQAKNHFKSQAFFANCSDKTISYNITCTSDDVSDQLNSTLLFIVDNSGLFPQLSKPTQQIRIIHTQTIIANVNDADKAKLFLICSLTGVVILIMVVFAAAIRCKISRLDRQIREVKEKKKQ